MSYRILILETCLLSVIFIGAYYHNRQGNGSDVRYQKAARRTSNEHKKQ